MTYHFGKEFKAWREKLYPNVRDIVFSRLPKFKYNQYFNTILAIEEGESLTNKVSVSQAHYICDALGLDEIAFCNGRIEREKTAQEILDEFEPCGFGTNAERVARLISHCVISYGRGCDIMKCSYGEGPPKVDSTGCNCLNCKNYIKAQNENEKQA